MAKNSNFNSLDVCLIPFLQLRYWSVHNDNLKFIFRISHPFRQHPAAGLMAEKRENGIIALPMIRNKKTLDPRDPDSPEVYQLETAMGSAVSVFDRAGAICVPRDRFIPVKNTNDLLDVRSDRYILDNRFHLIPNPEKKSDSIDIDLDPAYYKFIDDFEKRFPKGVPCLKNCRCFTVQGDFTFGKQVKVQNDSMLINTTEHRFTIEDHQVLNGDSAMVTDLIHRKMAAS